MTRPSEERYRAEEACIYDPEGLLGVEMGTISGKLTSLTILSPHVSALSSDSPTHVMSGESTRTSHADGL